MKRQTSGDVVEETDEENTTNRKNTEGKWKSKNPHLNAVCWWINITRKVFRGSNMKITIDIKKHLRKELTPTSNRLVKENKINEWSGGINREEIR